MTTTPQQLCEQVRDFLVAATRHWPDRDDRWYGTACIAPEWANLAKQYMIDREEVSAEPRREQTGGCCWIVQAPVGDDLLVVSWDFVCYYPGGTSLEMAEKGWREDHGDEAPPASERPLDWGHASYHAMQTMDESDGVICLEWPADPDPIAAAADVCMNLILESEERTDEMDEEEAADPGALKNWIRPITEGEFKVLRDFAHAYRTPVTD